MSTVLRTILGLACVLLLALPLSPGWLTILLQDRGLAALAVGCAAMGGAGLWVCWSGSHRTPQTLLAVAASCILVYSLGFLFTCPEVRRGSTAAFMVFFVLGLGVPAVCGLRSSLLILGLFGALESVVCIVQSLYGLGGIRSSDLFRPYGTVANVTVASHAILVSFALAFGSYVSRRSSLTLACTFLTLVALTLTWTRAAAVSAAFAGVAVGARSIVMGRRGLAPPATSRGALVLLPALLAVGAGPWLVRGHGDERAAASQRSSLSRLEQWHGGIAVFSDNFFGVGPGNVLFGITAVTPDHRRIRMMSVDPKNEAILLLATFGVLGLFIGCAYAYASVSLLGGTTSEESAMLYAACLGIAAVGLVDSPFLVPGREATAIPLGMITMCLIRLAPHGSDCR